MPYLPRLHAERVPELVSKEVRDGKVKVVYKAFQTATPSQQTFQTQQAAALAAGEQNRFWNYVELFYHQQGQEGSGYVNDNYLTVWRTRSRGSRSASGAAPATTRR